MLALSLLSLSLSLPLPLSLSLSPSPPSPHTDIVDYIAIANEAEKYKELLVPDEGAQYDQLIEINLDEVSLFF